MGLFGRKKEKMQEQGVIIEPPVMDEKITRSVLSNGFLDCSLYEREKNTTTSIRVNPDAYVIDNKIVYEMTVEWYGDESDTYYFATQSHNISSPPEKIYAGIDLRELQNNDQYLKYLMTCLLKQERVNGYIEMSKRTEQEINDEVARTGNQKIYPCGRYVGSIVTTDRGYRKTFYGDVGKYFHNTPEMVQERNECRVVREANRQAKIAEEKAKIAKLEKDDWNFR